MPRRQCLHEKDALQKCDVIADRRSAYLERCRQIGDIEQSCGFSGRQREEPWQRIEGADSCEIAHVTLDNRVQIVAIPPCTPPLGRPSKCGWVSTCDDPFRELISEPLRMTRFETGSKQHVQKGARALIDLRLSEGVKPQNLHPAGQRVG